MSTSKWIGVCIPYDEAEILSIKVAVNDRVHKGSILFSCKEKGESVEVPVKSPAVGVVKNVIIKEGTLTSKQDVVFIEENCDHSMVAFNLCAICGTDLKSNKEAPGHLSMVPAIPQVTVSQQEAHRLGNKDKQQLLESRKLALIVDLDQTLIHTSVDRNIERGLPDVYGFTLAGHPYLYHCRLRPHVREFLHTVSHLFELHVFTMATKDYAYAVTKILDPNKKLFSDRVISRDECFEPHSKAPRLKSVFPCGDEMVAIIDDREDVWGACPNLVHVKPYVFFSGTSDINAPPPPPPTANARLVHEKDLTSIAKHNTNVNNNKLPVNGSSSSSSDSSSSSSSDSDSSSDDGDDDNGGEQQKTQAPETATKSSLTDEKQLIKSESTKCTNGGPSGEERAVPTPRKLTTRKIDDGDNFLVHLGHVLTRIHNMFYSEFDELQKIEELETQPQYSKQLPSIIRTPDLKEIIPRLRKSVFNKCNILFSGIIPLGMPIEKSREWNTTKAFGGIVHTDLVTGLDSTNPKIVFQATTHLVLGRPDTNKYKRAKKIKDIKIVSPKWFWESAEQWVKQPEELHVPDFLSEAEMKQSKKLDKVSVEDTLKPDANAHISTEVSNQTEKLEMPYSRTFSVSSEELEKMEAEIDAELLSDESDEGNGENVEQLGSYLQLQTEDDSESFNAYLGLEEEDKVSRKRKRDDNEASSNSTSVDDGESDSSDDDDELAKLLMM